MITPDHSDQTMPSRRGARTGVVVAIVAAVVGGLTLIGLTSPDPEAVVATTTTSTTTTTLNEIEPLIDLDNFSAEQIRRGEPLEWKTTLSTVEGFPIALVRHQDAIYVFAVDVPDFSAFETGGLRVWRSDDGLTWESLGQVIDGRYRITSVSSVGANLVAAGIDRDNPGLMVWSSADGADWEPQLVPVEGFEEPMTVYAHAIGGTDDIRVVAGYVDVDLAALLEEKLGEAAHYGWGTEVVQDELRVTLYGPLGYPLAHFSGDELGLSEQTQQVLIDAYSPMGGFVANMWVKVGEEPWRQTTIEDAQSIDRITTTPEGEVIVHGWGPNTPGSWTTSDGVGWERVATFNQSYGDERWGDLLVTQGSGGGLSVLTSSDGVEWEGIGPDREWFPNHIDWWINTLTAGPGGIAATVNGWEREFQMEEPETTGPPPRVTGEDGTLIVDFESGEYQLEKDGHTYTWRAAPSSTGIAVDLETGLVRFMDPETEELLAEFPLQEIIDTQNEVWARRSVEQTGHDVFLFTSDGLDWTIQPIEDLGQASFYYLLAITETHVIATGPGGGGFFDPSSPPGFRVSTAEIP